MRLDMKQDAIDMLEAAGFKDVYGYESDYAPVWVSTKWVLHAWVQMSNSVKNKWNRL